MSEKNEASNIIDKVLSLCWTSIHDQVDPNIHAQVWLSRGRNKIFNRVLSQVVAQTLAQLKEDIENET